MAVETDIDSCLVKFDGISLGQVEAMDPNAFAMVLARRLDRGEDDDELVAPFQNYI